MTSITLPDSITSIGYEAFVFCESLASVTIPSSVTTIYGAAFRGCDSLVNITIPESVTYLGGDLLKTARTWPMLHFRQHYFWRATLVSINQRKIRSANQSSLKALVDNELDAAVEAARTIVNVSARVDLGQGEIVTPGFTVVGEQKKLLIRAVGPKLADLDVPSPMQNPTMSIYKSRWDGNPPDLVATIDDWKADNDNVAEIVSAMSSAEHSR